MPVFKIKQNGEWVDIAGGGSGGEIPDNLVYVSEENQESAVVPLDADTLGGYTVNTLKETLKDELKDEFLNSAYPIGSIYMSVNSTSPETLFGGTWEALEDRFLLGAGDAYAAGTTGGEAKHTLTVNEMPSHNHPQNARVHGYSGWSQIDTGAGYTVNINMASGGNYHSPNTKLNAVVVSMGGTSTSSTGGSQPHNNMPPYLSVYMWKRTA